MSESKAGHDFDESSPLVQHCRREGCPVIRTRPLYDSTVWLWADGEVKPARSRIRCRRRCVRAGSDVM